MPYLNLDPNFVDHPKTKRLKGMLGPLSEAYIIRLWAYCAKYHPANGTMKNYSDSEVEGVIGWLGEAKTAIDAFERVGLIERVENGWKCVDWLQHQGHLAAFSRRGKENAKKRWDKYATSNATSNASKKHSNAPSLPNLPTIPNQTNLTKPAVPTDLMASLFDKSFSDFQKAYPWNADMSNARVEWAKLKPSQELVGKIMAAIAAQKQGPQWAKGIYASPAKWLSGRRWEDVVAPADPEGDIGRELTRRIREEQR